MSGISGTYASALNLDAKDFEIDPSGIIIMKNPKAGKVNSNSLKLTTVNDKEKSAFMKLVHKKRSKK